MLGLLPERCEELVLLGAHCDDVAIGAGGALLELCTANPDLRVTALVCTGGGSAREAEERAALAEFCPGAKLEVTVLDFPDTRLPAYWDQVKTAVRELRERTEPDLVLAPSAHDAHQDHRLLAELAPNSFRDHLILGYEILKWEGDLDQPQVYLPLPEAVLTRKLDLLFEHYGTQLRHPWFDREAFGGLARVRGVQCHTRYAEAFHLNKMVIGCGPAITAR